MYEPGDELGESMAEGEYFAECLQERAEIFESILEGMVEQRRLGLIGSSTERGCEAWWRWWVRAVDYGGWLKMGYRQLVSDDVMRQLLVLVLLVVLVVVLVVVVVVVF